MSHQNPFALPKAVNAELRLVLDYWRRLRRGENDVPFADDVSLSGVPNSKVFLIKVSQSPLRFQFAFAQDALQASLPVGCFIDEASTSGIFSYLLTQCCATVEAGAPTFFRLRASDPVGDFSRLILPAWSDGHISLLLGAIG